MDFLELSSARSVHDFLQVHIDLLTGRARQFKAAYADTAARNYLGSGYTPLYADRGKHPRRPLTPPDAHTGPHGPHRL